MDRFGKRIVFLGLIGSLALGGTGLAAGASGTTTASASAPTGNGALSPEKALELAKAARIAEQTNDVAHHAESVSEGKELLSTKVPMLWSTLEDAVHLTRLYMDRPKSRADSVKLIAKLNRLMLETDDESNKAESKQLIDYIVGPALNDPRRHQFFDDVETIELTLSRDTTGKFKAFRDQSGFQAMAGRLGQDKQQDPDQFNYFMKQSSIADVTGARWTTAFNDLAAAQESLQKGYAKYNTIGRAIGYGAMAPIVGLSYVGGALAWGHLPLDLQWTLVGVVSDFTHERLKNWIRKYTNRRFEHWMPSDYKAMRSALLHLLEIDPSRTMPYLVKLAARPKSEDEGIEPLSDLAFQILLQDKHRQSTKALNRMGIKSLQDGDAERAKKIFEELGRRDPNGTLGKLAPEVIATLNEASSAESLLRKLAHHQLVKKALVAAPFIALGAWGADHIAGEDLSATVAVLRDVFVGAAGVQVARQIAKTLDAQPLKVATSDSEERMLGAFTRLQTLGPRGRGIIKALAENKIPNRAGTIIRQAARRAMERGAISGETAPPIQDGLVPRDHPQNQTGRPYHYGLEKLGPQEAQDDPAEARRIARAGEVHRRILRRGLCQLDFSRIGQSEAPSLGKTVVKTILHVGGSAAVAGAASKILDVTR